MKFWKGKTGIKNPDAHEAQNINFKTQNRHRRGSQDPTQKVYLKPTVYRVGVLCEAVHRRLKVQTPPQSNRNINSCGIWRPRGKSLSRLSRLQQRPGGSTKTMKRGISLVEMMRWFYWTTRWLFSNHRNHVCVVVVVQPPGVANKTVAVLKQCQNKDKEDSKAHGTIAPFPKYTRQSPDNGGLFLFLLSSSVFVRVFRVRLCWGARAVVGEKDVR